MRRNERGVALVMVILILLVLTVLGITAVVLMTQEDQISSRQELQKAAFYSAEAGLRRGEFILQNTAYSNEALTLFIAHAPTADCGAAPLSSGSDPHKPVPPPAALPTQWDLAHLGTYLQTQPGGVTELVNQEVTQQVTAGPTSRVRAFYTLYVRNNPEDVDPATGLPDPLVNRDRKLRLLAVGFLTDVDGVDGSGNGKFLAVKIMEEELAWNTGPGASYSRKEGNTGGTSSGFWSGSVT